LGRLQNLELILEAIRYVKNKNIHFLIIGEGVMEAYIEEFLQNNPELQITYINNGFHAERNKVLSSCDISIVSLKQGMYGLGVPSKAYFALAADKPIFVISDTGSELERLLREKRIGWHCEPGNAKTIADKIDNISHEIATVKLESSRDLISTEYDSKLILKKFVKEIKLFYA